MPAYRDDGGSDAAAIGSAHFCPEPAGEPSAVTTDCGGTARVDPKAAILHTMGEYPDFRKSHRDDQDDSDDWAEAEAEPLVSLKAQQEIAHDRGRICKKRGCVVCAPLVEKRRLKKKERKAETQALAHSKGKPCGRSSCELPVCVEALKASAAAPAPVPPPSADQQESDDPQADLDLLLHRQAEKHKIGLPCGSESCRDKLCIDGFANERLRRHRANRPCRSATCHTPICVAARSKS